MEKSTRRIAKYSGFEKRKFPFIYLFIAFPVIQFLVFWVYVNSSSIAFSIIDGDGNLTWENFAKIFRILKGEETYLGWELWPTIKRSILLWGLDFFILFPIGVVTTYILYRRLPGHYVFRICYIIPSLMGAVMWAQLIRYLSQSTGALTMLVKALGFNLPKLALHNGLFQSEETAFKTIISIKIVMGLVGNNAVLTGAFSRVPDEIYESADLDGAGFWRTFACIAVPCVWSTIATLLTFSLCSCITADYNVFLFTNGNGDYNTSTIGFLLYSITLSVSNSSKPYYGEPAALGVFLTVITVPVVLVGRRIIESIYADVEI